VPDRKALGLNLRIGRSFARGAVRKDERVGDGGEGTEDCRVSRVDALAGADDMDMVARWHGERSG